MKVKKTIFNDGFSEIVHKRIKRDYSQEVSYAAKELVAQCKEGLKIYERLKTEKRGRTIRAIRTRMKIERDGLFEFMRFVVNRKKKLEGFTLLNEKKYYNLTCEYLLPQFAKRINAAHEKALGDGSVVFTIELVEKAKEILIAHNIDVPLPI